MMSEQPTYHVPVMLTESIDALVKDPAGIYVDVTMGGGGHSREALRRLDEGGRLICLDQDEDAVKNVPKDERVTFCRTNFRYLRNWLHYHDAQQVDGILADLGVSSHHLDDATRGFSFRADGPLDMRMNQQATRTAATVVNTYTEEALANVLNLYGELKNSRALAKALVKARATQPLQTIGALLEVVSPLMPREREKKELAKVFQALRIEVNDEMGALREMLESAAQALKPGGRLVVITYHSLEDRLVKNLMKSGNVEGKVQKDFYGNLLSPFGKAAKVVVPSDEEIERNPRARSAKLRVAERV
ncbi:MAG: 16S rRNA (cytosine(1402)-N(4))-methyltransferase RsmH [Bacteroidaceae bacterium]|nr:16S rRNA (cytosine(1402)-N(4))-methyltransferase RsmH [Bacteroidaceae bacterium]MBQ9883531.1 16S rRNA (cytosine(1402)-N(4))-methyltransferase RsmH [Bacteroidaceae bacterium]